MIPSIMLSDAWDKHIEWFDKSNIVQSVDNILQNKNTNNISTWKSSLRQIDPVSLFEKALPKCPNCFNGNEYKDLDKLHKNTCNCELKLCEEKISVVEKNPNDRKYVSKPLFRRSKDDDDSSGETDSCEESKAPFKPNFGHVRNANKHPGKSSAKTSKELDSNIEIVDDDKAHRSNVAKITFRSAREHLLASNPAAKKTLGASRKAKSKFVSPMLSLDNKEEPIEQAIVDDRLKHLDPKMVELIESEIIERGTPIGWDDIAGLQMAKSVIQEAVVWPLLRPDIFTGLRRPPKGILLFGPPGTGKTLIGKCVASQCNATFFNISASSLTSKWIGDGEKMVRALFAVARCHQPAVIFIDEIDSLLTHRSDSEHEATRRIKTEFLVQFDGAATADEDRLLIIGATNRPQELDEAARRRLVKRLYIPLPDVHAREQIIHNLLKSESNVVSAAEVTEVSRLAEGYSGADVRSLCSEAAMGPVRAVPLAMMVTIQRDKVRPMNMSDFKNALERVKPSVSQDDLGQYVYWNNTYGQGV